MLMDAPLSLTRPKRAAASATVVKIGQSLREQDSTITEARTNPSALPVVAKRAKRLWDCEQGRQRNRGSGFCEHGRARSRCKECGGVGICEHERRRDQCKECGGMSVCKHGRQRYSCKECSGTGICEHGRRRCACKDCGGSSICEHGRQRCACKDCGGSQICEHGRQRNRCIECGGTGICKHSKRRSYCKECRGGAARGPLGRCKVQQAPTVSEGTVDEGWDVLSEDEEFRDALAVELFPEDALFAEVDWEDVGWD